MRRGVALILGLVVALFAGALLAGGLTGDEASTPAAFAQASAAEEFHLRCTGPPSSRVCTETQPPTTTETVPGPTTTVTQTVTVTTTPEPELVGIYWGGEIRNASGDCPQNVAVCADLEAKVGKKMSAPRKTFSVRAGDGTCSAVPFTALNNAIARGYLATMNYAWKGGPDSTWQLADVLAGNHDACMRTQADALRDWGKPIILRGPWEMNIANQFPWQVKGGYNGNAVSDFAPAWRHVVDLFAQEGAANVEWMFAPNVDPTGVNAPIEALFPGVDYVDWIALDGYNQTGSTTFSDRFASTYARLVALAPGKPFSVAETGSIDGGSVSSSAYIQGMFADFKAGRYPAMHLLNWSNYVASDGKDWRIEATPARLAAFKAGIADSSFIAAP